ncbi:hypothetical protein [Streptomyces sp. NPDC004976]
MVLAVAGLVLLAMPHPPSTQAPADAPTVPATSPRSPSAPASTNAHAADPAPASVLPPKGEGTAGDQAIQRALEASWPADLSVSDERRLLAAGRDLLRADATGIGRGKWPELFPSSGPGLAPAFSTARFRIQAAIARRDHRPGRAVVHLVWAGTDRGGTYTDGRITDLYFTRTSQEGLPVWVPQPRT